MENKGSFIKKLLIAFALILLILFCASQKQASALVLKNQVFLPSVSSNNQSFIFNYQRENHWFDFNFTSNWTNTSDFDLVGLRFKRLAYLGDTYENNSPYSFSLVDNSFTMTAVLWDSNNNAQLCYTSAEIDNVFLCPIQKNVSYKGFSIVGNVANISTPDFNLNVNIEFEQNANFYNFDSTDIINYLEQNGNAQVVQQQTQDINNNLNNSDVSGATTGGLNDINNNASAVNSQLDTAIGTGNFVSIFTNFFSQIDNSTCSPISLPIPYTQQNLVLPCLGTEFSNRIPLLWTLYTTIITGIIVARFWHFYIDMFKHLLDPYSTGLHGVSDIAGGGK